VGAPDPKKKEPCSKRNPFAPRNHGVRGTKSIKCKRTSPLDFAFGRVKGGKRGRGGSYSKESIQPSQSLWPWRGGGG